MRPAYMLICDHRHVQWISRGHLVFSRRQAHHTQIIGARPGLRESNLLVKFF